MADNIQLNSGTGGATLAADDISSVYYPIGKVAFGALDTATLVTSSSGFPVQQQTSAVWDFNLKQYNGSAVAATNPVYVQLSNGTTALTAIPITDNSGSITVDNAGTFAVQVDGSALTALQLIDNLVLSEDAAHVSGDPGVQILAVRRDTAASSTATDGDYATLNVDSTGRLWCNVSNTVTVTGAGGTFPVTDNSGSLTVDATTAAPLPVYLLDAAGGDSCMDTTNNALRVNIVTGGGSGGTSATDDSAFTPATGSVTPVGGIVTSDSVDAGDVGAFAMLANRQQKVTLYDSSGVELSVGGGTQYDEDTASANAQKLTMAGVTRADTAASQVDTDGDRTTLIVDSSGRLHVNVGNTVTVGSHAVTNAGTFVVQENGAALTALQLLDDAVYTDDTSTHSTGVSKGYGVMAVATPTDASVNANDFGHVAMTTDRKLHVSVQDSLPAGTNAIGKLSSNTGVTIGAVEIAAAQTLATVTTVSTLTGSGVAHDGVDSGNPHKIGAKAETSLSGITLVADGDRTDLYAGVDGVLIVRPHSNLEDVVQERTTNTDGASTAFASGLGAPGAGVRLWITNVTICNSSSSFCTVDLRDGAAGSVLWTIPVPATGGAVQKFDPPLRLSANTALAFDASAATTTLTISANGFRSKI